MNSPRHTFRIILVFIFSIFFSSSTNATHVVGGGITYTQMEGFNYLLTVRLYRDCSPGTYQMPNSVDLQCRRGDGTMPGTSVYNLPRIASDTISPGIPACTFDPGICVEEGIFQAIVSLPPGVGGYHLYYTICCRNGTVLNIQNPLGARETFYAYVPDVNIYLNNSSPFFNTMPPVYVCAGEDLNLNFSATDFDGDSLVYSFYTPYDGNAGTGITYPPGTPPNNINISPVTWQAGFGANDPLDGAPGLTPGLTIDNTGQINGIPTVPGQYVVGVMVDEYRDGVLIGRITRDFQFNVLNCPPIPQAGIDVADYCNGLNIDFVNTSVAATTFWWDFGTGNPADTSVTFQPSFAYTNGGNYSVTLITQKGTECADTAVFNMDIEDYVLFTVSTDSISCNGLSNGSANANGGNYSYYWSTNNTGNSVTNLGLGNYWVEATSSIGCVDTQNFIIEEPDVLQVQFNETQPLCNGDQNGFLEAIGLGGVGPYTYYWPTAAYNGSTLPNIGAGNYGVTVTDNNGCVLNQNGILNEPQILSTSLIAFNDVTCYGMADANAEIQINGGTQPYTVDWLTLPNDSVYMDNLSAGNYVVETTDYNNCLTTMVITISEPSPISVDIVIIENETCSDNNGAVFADVTGGVGSIDFYWNPMAPNQDVLYNISAGPISITIQDDNGCTAIDNDTLLNFATGVASIGSLNPVTCQNGSNGSVEVLMTGGTGPFTYNWSCSCPNSNSISGLTMGSYDVEVIDFYGCIDSLSFVIDELPALTLDVIDSLHPLCYGDDNGSGTVQAAGGTQPYNYYWNTSPNQIGANAIGLTDGNYSITVIDSNDCIAQTTMNLVEPNELTIQTNVISNILCNGDSTGIATATGAGGTLPYTYFWNELNVYGDSVSNLVAGHYSVTLTDTNGCQITGSVDVVEYDNVTAEIVYDSIFCPGDTILFTVLTNGMNNLYDYSWEMNGLPQGTSNTFSAQIFSPSQIEFSLISTINCPTISDSINVEPISLEPGILDVIGTPDTICLGSSAMVEAQISDWSHINAIYWNIDLQGVGPHMVTPQGEFTYVVTIHNICGAQLTDSTTVNLFMPPNASILAYETSSCDSVNAYFAFEYEDTDYALTNNYWTIFGEDYPEENPSVHFDYSTDFDATLNLSFSNGCTFEYVELISINVWESPEANFYYNPDPATQAELTEFIDISHGNPVYWEWYIEGDMISNDERPTHVFDEQGEFYVTEIIVDENGCSDTITLPVEVIGDFTVYVPNAFTPDGSGYNNTFKPIMYNVQEEDYKFQIFNRWGELIFEADFLDAEWDGQYNGDFVADGVYIYKIIVKDNRDQKHEYIGNVTLLR